jgi:hypothetical protein
MHGMPPTSADADTVPSFDFFKTSKTFQNFPKQVFHTFLIIEKA